MRYEILEGGVVVNTIIADDAFVTAHYPGAWRLAADQGTPAATPPEWEWYIDIGPFFDRFAGAKLAVLTSADAGVQAIITDAQVRKWINLKLPEVAQSVAYIASKVPAVTAAIQTAILTTPVAPAENLALRKLYFGA